MKKLAVALSATVAMFLVGMGAERAEAAGFRVSFGVPGIHVSSGYGHGAYGFGHGRSSCYRGSSWHDTSHYDYVPPRYKRHGNHYHFQPGGYFYHRDGHWHH